MVCRVTSKAKGVGCAERHWKATKRNTKGKRGELGSEIIRKLSTISATYSYEHSMIRRHKSQRTSKLWEEEDFQNYNNFCAKTVVTGRGKATRIFRAWDEGWEKVQFDSTGDEKFAAQMSAK